MLKQVTDVAVFGQSVQAVIVPLPPSPVAFDVSRCGPGILVLTANSSNPIYWFDQLTGGNQIGTGNNNTTPVLLSNTTTM